MNTQQSNINSRSRRALVGAVLIILPATLLGTLLAGGNAQADELPPRPVTPMPLLTPVPLPEEPDLQPHAAVVIADGDHHSHIALQLRTTSNTASLLTIVQWQDPQGGWHDVEGWQAQTVADGSVRWVVYPRDFNTGPFRWAVYSGRGGKLVGKSGAFRLPCCAGESVVNEIVIR